MQTIIPWNQLTKAIESFYPKPQSAGRRPIGIERMLRVPFIQHRFNLPAVEEAAYDSRALRQFVGLDLGSEAVTDETTICKFRHLMKEHNPGDQRFHLVKHYLKENGLKVSRETSVDTTIINVPSFTRNKKKVHYHGLDKNALRLFLACALSNSVMARKMLLRQPVTGMQPSFT